MENWNFHGYIAIPLEMYGKNFIGENCITADEIETGKFVDAMLQILSVKYGTLEEVSDFVESSSIFVGLLAREIPKDTAKTMFEDFERLLKN